MNPKVLFVGGDKGSWEMRGKQIGEQLGARYAAKHITPADWAWPDIVVLVKRAPEQWFSDIKRHCRAVLVWDVLDFWRQPTANDRTQDDLVREIHQTARALGVTALIGATRAMATDIGGGYIPHHHRVGLRPTPPRARVTVVGYDGSPRYLGRWRAELEHVCAQRGLTLVINPEDLSQVDLLVSFRDKDWDGWACRHWKSGVKYGNALAAGRPILTQACTAFEEIRPVGAIVEAPADLGHALDAMAATDVRTCAYEEGLRRARDFSIGTIATHYHRLFSEVLAHA